MWIFTKKRRGLECRETQLEALTPGSFFKTNERGVEVSFGSLTVKKKKPKTQTK